MATIVDLYKTTLSAASPSERIFIELVHRDIKRFAESPARRNSVFCFPKMHEYYRYRIQMVGELFQLVTCLIGDGEYRCCVIFEENVPINKYHFNLMVKEFYENHPIPTCYVPYQS